MKKTGRRGEMAQIWFLFKKLSRPQKIRIVARLEKETREERWNHLTEKLSSRFQKNPVSDEEITQIVREVRQERYGRSQNRS